jgi:amidophosphoribosyltransferase
VAHGRDYHSIATEIGADLVIFQTLPDLEASVRQLNPSITMFDCSVFTGDYVTGGVDEEYLQHLEGLRADNIRGKALVNGHGHGPVNGTGIDQSARGQLDKGQNSPVDDTVGLHNSWKSG